MLLQKICRKFRGLFHDREIYDRGINLLGEDFIAFEEFHYEYSIFNRNKKYRKKRERERETRANIKRFESVFEKESFSRLWRT